jgi:PqqD family protein of HPr-rel-A system
LPASAPAAAWQLVPGQLLVHREWDGEYVLYNDLSGDTHLIDSVALRVLQALQRAPATEAALASVLGAGTGHAAGERLLADLEGLSLVQLCQC